ncbi:outer membrane lipoprotein-sorting protein [Natroniella sp. ANB-PHB2]|uniref:outer membrane lipoprotein-sorting protein n=1 Tax=Natroniella sp. ANB-PHB2 TaxID=3384444 RepID=UPI0038D4018C
MKKDLLSFLLISLLVFSLSGVVSAELTGNDILDKVEESISATTSQIEMQMELHSGGRVRERRLKIERMEGANKDKSLIRFSEPASVEGTAFLSLDEKDSDDDDMYLFMPALGNVRRIAGSQRNGSFVGTDFTYNDLSLLGGGSYEDDYDATILEEKEDEYILKIVPTDDDIDYSYGKMWVTKSNWFPERVEFYDQDEELEKVLINEDIKQIDGYWTADQITMEDVQNETKTVLFLDDIIYDEDLDSRTFTTRNLRRY